MFDIQEPRELESEEPSPTKVGKARWLPSRGRAANFNHRCVKEEEEEEWEEGENRLF